MLTYLSHLARWEILFVYMALPWSKIFNDANTDMLAKTFDNKLSMISLNA